MRCYKCTENRRTFEELLAHITNCKGFGQGTAPASLGDAVETKQKPKEIKT